MKNPMNNIVWNPRAEPSWGTLVLNPDAVRFIIVAAAGFVVQLLVLDTLVSRANVVEPIAVAFAVEAAILHNFFWHERWTFGARDLPEEGVVGRLVRYNGAMAIVSILGNVILTTALRLLLPIPVAVANAMSVATLSVVGWVLADRWAFRT